MPTMERTATGRPGARARVAHSLSQLTAARHAREGARRQRAVLRHTLGAALTEDPRFWRATTPEARAELLRQLNEDRTVLGQEPLEELPDPRLQEFAALFHRQCVEVQQGVPAESGGEPCLEPFVEEVAAQFGEEWLAEQNVNLHNHLALAKLNEQAGPGAPAPRPQAAEPGADRAKTQEAAPGPMAEVHSWRENYRRLLRPYAVTLVPPEARRLQFREHLRAWRRLHQYPNVRPELRPRFLAALLRESAALGLGWTPAALQAYVAPAAAPVLMQEDSCTPATLAFLEHLHAHLGLARNPHLPRGTREASGGELLRALFALDQATAEGLAGLPPALQLRVLRNQGVVARGEVASKSAWERAMFTRLLPRPGAGTTAAVRRKCHEATRTLARELWRYAHDGR
jgi:hypothetical protein